MTTRAWLVCIAVFALAPAPAIAQTALATANDDAPNSRRDDDHVTRPIVPFLEGSYLFRSSERHVLFEAAVFPHLVFFQNFDDLIDARLPPDADHKPVPAWHRYWAISLTPGVRVRMLDAFSDPVRTPSYMPRFDVQKLFAINRSESVRDLTEGRMTHLRLFEAHFSLQHHSNGQDGCLFTDQSAVQNGKDTVCEPEYKDRPVPGIINRHDGSFSTNDWRAGINFRHTDIGLDGNGIRHVGLGVEYQQQFATDADQRPFYPQYRINGTASVAWAGVKLCASRVELSSEVTLSLDHPVSSVPRAGGSVGFSCFPSIKGGFGFFVRGYWGPDYYNLGFLDRIARLQIGLTFNQDGLFRFRLPDSSKAPGRP